MGRDVANQAAHNKDKTKQLCALAVAPGDFTNCVIGAAKEIISYYHSDKESLAFCNILDATNKAVCIDTTHTYYSKF
jgi:hypothetical protein